MGHARERAVREIAREIALRKPAVVVNTIGGYAGSAAMIARASPQLAHSARSGRTVTSAPSPARRPGPNSFAERYAGTLRRECLDHLLIHSEQHLWRILTEYAQHYNDHRPHQSREQRPPLHDEPGQAIDMTGGIKRTHIIQGLSGEYRRTAWRAPETPAQGQCATFGTGHPVLTPDPLQHVRMFATNLGATALVTPSGMHFSRLQDRRELDEAVALVSGMLPDPQQA